MHNNHLRHSIAKFAIFVHRIHTCELQKKTEQFWIANNLAFFYNLVVTHLKTIKLTNAMHYYKKQCTIHLISTSNKTITIPK
jgi:hypothetical protein